MTIEEAARKWVGEMNAIPYGMIEKLMSIEDDDISEVTEPAIGDRVYVFNLPEEYAGNDDEGEIEDILHEENACIIKLDDGTSVKVCRNDLEVEYYSALPMWGTLWMFGDSADDWWLEKDDGIKKMSECGFRVYESEEFGYFFGIDGAGYDFYEAHWIPLYKARGLKWHDR